MKRRFWAGLLSFVMLWSLLPASALAAEGDTPEPDTGLSFVKTVDPVEGEDGTYKITMEAYAKGETVSVSKTEPCDIVLVLDVSGSMKEVFSQNEHKGYEVIKRKHQTRRANNQELWDEFNSSHDVYYKVADDDYREVTVTREVGEPTYEKITRSFTYWDVSRNSGKYFAQKDGETGYLPVEIRDDGWFDYELYIGDEKINTRWKWNDTVFVSGYTFYTREPGKVIYTYTYNSTDTTTTEIETSVGDDTVPGVYYRPVYGSEYKIEALQKAANAFIDSVLEKNPENAEHKIAIVKFAGDSTDKVGNDMYNEYWWGGYNTYNYSQVVDELTDVTDDTVKTLKAHINALQPTGATRADYGMQHAANLLSKSDSGRKQIVVMFTDGEPTSTNKFENPVANGAIAAAKDLKDQGVTVYTIGMFKEANPADTSNTSSNFNKYMHYVSSNYPNAVSMSDNGGNGGNNGYYKKATSAADLSEIFSQITSEVGSTTVTLDSSAVMVDTVSDHFVIPTGSTVSAWSVPCTGFKNGEPIWETNEENWEKVTGITVEGKKVSVTGFDYSDHFVTDVTVANKKAAKLVVEFTVEPNKTTLRGWLPTNVDSKAYIFENEQATVPAASTAAVPNVDIQPIVAEVKGGVIEAAPKVEVNLFGTNGFSDYTTADGTNNAGVKITYTLVQVDEKGNALSNAVPKTWTVDAGSDTISPALAMTVTAPAAGGSNRYKLTVTVTSTNPNVDEDDVLFAEASDIVTVTAKADEPTEYTVNYVPYAKGSEDHPDGNIQVPASASYVKDAEVTVAGPLVSVRGTNKDGERGTWNFKAWTTDDVEIESGKFKMPEKDVTLTGTWEFVPDKPIVIDPAPTTGSVVITKEINGVDEKDIATVKGFDFNVEGLDTEGNVIIAGTGSLHYDGAKLTTATISDLKAGSYVLAENLNTAKKAIPGYELVSVRFVPEEVKPDIQAATDDFGIYDLNITAGETVKVTCINTYKKAETEPTYTVTYTDGVNGSAFADQVNSGLKSGDATPAFNGTPTRSGYTFNGWNPKVADTVTGDATYTATWTKNGGHDDDSRDTYYLAILKVDAQDGHVLKGAKFGLYADGKQIATATSGSDGYAVFSLDERDYNELRTKDEIYYTELTAPEGYVRSSREYTVSVKDFTKNSMTKAKSDAVTVKNSSSSTPDRLNDEDHFAYVIGYKDGNVRPYGLISRAETTTIFFRLLKDSVRDGNLLTSNTYTDVPDNYWANTAISTMTGLGIVQGRTATTFDPQAPITRAQFAAICARFDDGKTQGTQTFTDIQGHWAQAYIERAAELGWIKGFEDGSFRPDTYITRAQAMTMINRVLNRIPEENGDLLSSMNVWPDCNPGDWFYLAVQEATNSHDYKHKAGNYETWTSMNKDPNWTRYEN